MEINLGKSLSNNTIFPQQFTKSSWAYLSATPRIKNGWLQHLRSCMDKLFKDAFPAPAESTSVITFTETEDDVWTTEGINAEPAINGNEALHTAAFYTDSFVGDVTIQATLDNQLIGTNNWADVATVTFTGTETDPTPQNYTGVFSYIRFKTTTDPASKITKILVRN